MSAEREPRVEGDEHDARACAEALAALDAFLDGEVDAGTGATLAAHLEACRACGLEADDFRRIKDAVAGGGNGIDAPLLQRLRAFALSMADEAPH